MSRILPILLLFIYALVPRPVSALESTWSLARLMSRDEAIRLRHAWDTYALSLPVSARHQVLKARLHLELTHSNVLVGRRSQLKVQLNGWHVAQLKFDPEHPHVEAEIPLPADRFKPGYNQLGFQVAQHYTEAQCESPQAPELWTEIDSVKSRVVLEWTPTQEAPTLAGLDRLYDETLRDLRVNIVQATPAVNDKQRSWGSWVAQGIALRLRYAPFRIFPGRWQEDAAGDRVLIGRREDLAAYLPKAMLERITGPYLAVRPYPANPGAIELVLSGRDDAEVSQAAQAFTRLRLPFPDSADVVISALDPLEPEPGPAPGILREGLAYELEQLGIRDITLENAGQSLEVELNLPADLHASDETQVELWLHLAYRAGLRRDSVLNVEVNGVFQNSVHLAAESGAEYRGYHLAIPLKSFHPGRNLLRFSPYPAPLISGECAYLQDRFPVTIYRNSMIQLPRASHYVRLPDLGLFGRTGFPYIQAGDGSTAAIELLDDEAETLAAAWQLAGRWAQQNGAPLTRLTITRHEAGASRHRFLLGSIAALRVRGAAPGAPWWPGADSSRLRLTGERRFEAPEPSFADRLARLLGEERPLPADARIRPTRTQLTGDLGRQRLLMAYPAAGGAERVETVLTAQTPGGLLEAAQSVTQAELAHALNGDLALWLDGPETLVWQDGGAGFYLGDASQRERLGAVFARHPWFGLGSIALSALAFAALGHRLLVRFKRRHGPVDDLDV